MSIIINPILLIMLLQLMLTSLLLQIQALLKGLGIVNIAFKYV